MSDEQSNALSIKNLQETNSYIRGEIEGVFITIWNRPPTVETLEEATAPMREFYNQPIGPSASWLVISTSTTETVSICANKRAKNMVKQYAKQLKPFAVVEASGGRSNSIALRMLLVVAGFFGIGPSMSFFTDPIESCKWIASERKQYGTPLNENLLTQAVQWMISRHSENSHSTETTHQKTSIKPFGF